MFHDAKYILMMFIVMLFSLSLCNDPPTELKSGLNQNIEVPVMGDLTQPSNVDFAVMDKPTTLECSKALFSIYDNNGNTKTSLILVKKESFISDVNYHLLEFTNMAINFKEINSKNKINNIEIFDFGLSA